MERLFVYGTLKDPRTQEALVGRRLASRRGSLHGYRLSRIRLGRVEYPIIEEGGREVVDGLVLEVSLEDLKRLDEYEGDDYRRVTVVIESGETCWAYVR